MPHRAAAVPPLVFGDAQLRFRTVLPVMTGAVVDVEMTKIPVSWLWLAFVPFVPPVVFVPLLVRLAIVLLVIVRLAPALGMLIPRTNWGCVLPVLLCRMLFAMEVLPTRFLSM